MKVKGVNEEQLQRIVKAVSAAYYDQNVTIKESRDLSNSAGYRSSFTLKVRDSRGMGAKRSWQGRRTVAACWHAHWRVLNELFSRYPDATVQTMLANYTVENWEDKAESTRDTNVGSVMQPAYPDELCECGW